ncbi:glutamine synthetase family protein [Eubacteriaceae bacterium ES3]|nr:glutamine synthetase family protein [Eubacteriaceae bacterium ES3]
MDLEKDVLDAFDYIQENDVKFIRLQFCDLLGQNRNVAITAKQMERVIYGGMPFDGSLVPGLTAAGDSDLVLVPDMSTIQLLPWRPQRGKVARIICDIKYPDGRMYESDSRQILKKSLKKAEQAGYDFYIGTGCEFYLFKLNEEGNPTTEPTDQAGYFDLAPYDRGENTRREICLTLEDMGFEIESSRHEKGPGQHEIDFEYDTALCSADKLMTFRTVVKTISQRNGIHASFLPKPIMDEPGSGMHLNVFLEKNGDNLFQMEEGKLCQTAQSFVAGVLAHIKGITAVANPLVNSYKRLIGGQEAPRFVSFGYGNQLPLIKIPAEIFGHCRFELRSPDPTCNPYLIFALVLEAGLEGIEKQMVLEESLMIANDMDYESQLEELPMTLMDALREMEKDPLIEAVLGSELKQKYIDLKKVEWNEYTKTVHPWEIDHYLSVY